jgi:hypothetical protein
LGETFTRFCERETGYDALDERIRMTVDKRAQLLAVLELPPSTIARKSCQALAYI